MATYLPGITDYIPQIQPFKPDFSTYNKILQVKQSQTDEGRKRIGSAWASLLYAPMTAPENIKKRDDYFKMIEQDLKKISAMDLSLPQNVSSAMKILDPIIEDPYIPHDMAFTKEASNQYEIGQSYKRCTDPKECGGYFWEEGLAYINLKRKEYEMASPQERLKMRAPSYSPLINLTEKAFEWTKAAGLVVESVTPDGRYFVTKQNGKEMFLPLTMIYNALYSKDPKVRDMFNVSAYLLRKNYIDQNKDKFGGDEQKAEDQWFVDIMSQTVPKQLETQQEVEQISNFANNKKAYLGQKLQYKNVSERVRNDDLWDEYQDADDNATIADQVKSNYDNIANVAKTLKLDMDDREMLRSKIDNITASGLLQQELTKVAGLYAISHNAVTKITEDKFALQAQSHSFAMQRLMTKANLDLRNAFLTESMSMSGELFNSFNMGGLGPANEGKVRDPGVANITEAYGKGGKDLFKENFGLLQKATYTKEYARKNMLDKMQNHLNQVIATGSPQDVRYVKSVMKSIFKDAYDENSNKFVKGGMSVNDYSELDLNAVDISKFFANASTVLKTERELFKGLKSDKEFNRSMQVELEYGILSQHMAKGLNNNLKMIYDQATGLRTDLNIENINAFRNLFTVYDNGKVKLKTRKEFIESAVSRMTGSQSEERKRKIALDMFEEQTGELKRIWNSGKIKGLQNPVGTTLVGVNPDGGTMAKVIEYTSSPLYPFSSGTRGLLSIFDNMKEQGAVDKVLFGEQHMSVEGGGNDVPENLYYPDLSDNAYARRMLYQLEQDMRNGRFTNKDKNTPDANFYISEVGANRADLNVVTVKPSYQWLEKFATTKDGVKYAFGKPIDELATQGVSIYLNSKNSNNLLFNELKKNPWDIIMDTGEPVQISFPNASDVTLQKRDGKTTMNGTIWGYEKAEDGSLRKSNIKTFQNLAWPEESISSGTLYNAFLNMALDLNADNLNYINNGTLPGAGAPMQEYIMNALGQTGKLNPTPEQLAIQNFQQNFAQRMRLADAIFKTISQY